MKTIYLTLFVSLSLLTGCAQLKKNITPIRPIFYASNEYGGRVSYFIGIRFGCTNEFFTPEMENILMPNTDGGGSSGRSGGSSSSGSIGGGGGCSGGNCSIR